MNHLINTLRRPWLDLVAFRGGKLRRMAREAVKGPPVTTTDGWAVQPSVRALAAAYAQLMLRPNYFAGSVWLALLVGVVLAAVSTFIFTGHIPLELLGLGPLVVQLTGLAVGTLGCVALGAAFAKDWGPEIVTGKSWAACAERLSASLDNQVRPASLLMTLLLLSFVMADGALAGTSIIAFFKAYFTPPVALFMAVLWGVLVGVVLWELSSAAADEYCVDNARRMARRMDAGTSVAERAAVDRLLELVGTRIGIDLEDRTSYWRRGGFWLVVVILAVGSVLLRTAAPAPAPSSEPSALVMQRAAALAADEEITVPEPGGGVPADAGPPAEGGGNKAGEGLLSALLLASVFIGSGAALYWSKCKACFLNRTQSPSDYAVTRRFSSGQEAQVFNRNYGQGSIAGLDRKLQRFAREVEIAKKSLRPQQQLLWAPFELRATDLIGAQWAGNFLQIGE